ncbi:MAG: phage Gp37/Gp68 family protein [Verrucomicrobiota bacterium]
MATSPRSAKKTTSRTKALKKATQPADAKKKPQAKGPKPAEVEIAEVEEQVEPLTQAEQNELAELEAVVETASAEVGKKEGELTNASRTIAEALHQIHSKNLYRGKSTSFADYSRKRFNYSLAHAKRLAAAGKIWTLGKTSEHKDVVALIKNEAMARPLSGLKDAELEQVYATIAQWMRWKQTDSLSNRMIAAAIAYHRPASGPKSSKLSKQVEAIRAEIAAIKGVIDEENRKLASESFGKIEVVLGGLVDVKRSTGISWTDHTWNPIVGCRFASTGCLNCYAAFQMGTLMASMHKDLVDTKTARDGKREVTRYKFNGKIKLLPEKLDEPLRNSTPSMYFANSLSDLFYKEVSDEFIEAAFKVMEKAHWHIFQVLTKRPDNMARFTNKYFEGRTPPPNIWLGTSTENQTEFDKRLPHLQETKAAVRWLSMEPLVERVEVASLDGVDWVVVGGESGSEARKMDADWVREIRGVCEASDVPFFFKQWGKYGEEGQELKGKAAKEKARIDGVEHLNWPAQHTTG